MFKITNSLAFKVLIFFVCIVLFLPIMKSKAQSRDQLIELTGDESAQGIIIGFFGPDMFIKSEKISPWISVAHSCLVDDNLILEKVEIYGEIQEPAFSVPINKSLRAMGMELEQFRELMKEAEVKKGKLDKLTESKPSERSEAQKKEVTILMNNYRKSVIETQPLYKKIYSEFHFPVDLKELKNPEKGPVVVGDKIPITAKIFFSHKGQSIILTKTIISKCIPDPFEK